MEEISKTRYHLKGKKGKKGGFMKWLKTQRKVRKGNIRVC